MHDSPVHGYTAECHYLQSTFNDGRCMPIQFTCLYNRTVVVRHGTRYNTNTENRQFICNNAAVYGGRRVLF